MNDGLIVFIGGTLFLIVALLYARSYDKRRDEIMHLKEIEKKEGERTGVWRDVTL